MTVRKRSVRGSGRGGNTTPTHPVQSWTIPMETPMGWFIALLTPQGLAQLRFPTSEACDNIEQVWAPPTNVERCRRQTERALLRSLTGTVPGELPEMDWNGATRFQQDVWRTLLEIPKGEVMSYGEVARRMGRPQSARAVGAACGANPIPVLVPCHRVLAADRTLGGFSGGLDWKRRLLALEGVSVAPGRA